jgi:hypothetical protein
MKAIDGMQWTHSANSHHMKEPTLEQHTHTLLADIGFKTAAGKGGAFKVMVFG